ncbi:MAG TPA: biotin carboxylase N-terminal domain-containing protein [Mycobacterium sp.]|nr:biotin carboxylase N-terminal domain-containing protein [Mycobacterium sp.]
MKIRRVFIANRGEIAVRIIRTCQRLGIETVLGASEADLDSLPARLASQVIRIGPAKPAASYLNVEAVVGAAAAAGADAIHPGYGFLSENASLARSCLKQGLLLIGPTEEQLLAIGDKLKAREHAIAAGLPVAPGGPAATPDEATVLAKQIGYPLLVKAVGGGGGRGMKLVREPSALIDTAALAMAEAEAAFGDRRVYLERFVASGRHVEVQIIGDGERVVHLGDRDCSVQRRYQKLMEEAPAPGLPERLREEIRAAGVRFGHHLGYRGLGTVEFLVDRDRGDFFFLEMNARIQVEHPVTEAITGLDLVAEQISVAEGRPLRVAQDEVHWNGHAVECRLNAERWRQDFRPSPGTVTAAVFPVGPNIRVDTHVQRGAKVPPFYDSLLAKIIVHGADRADALVRLRGALALCRVDGVETNLGLCAQLADDPEFMVGGVDTGYLARFLERRA